MTLRDVLAENFKKLRGAYPSLKALTVLAAKEVSSTGTLDRVLKSQVNVGLDLLEPLARVYGFEPWQLLHPDFDPKKELPEDVKRSSVVGIPQTQTLESHLRGLSGYLTQLSPKGRVHAKSALAALVDDPEDVDGVAATIRAQIGLANEAEGTSRQQKFISSTNVG